MEIMGTIYLLHYDGDLGAEANDPRHKARHYTGFYLNPGRIEHHRDGTSDVAIVNAFLRAGFGFVIARSRPGTRAEERRIKRAGGAKRYCPICVAKPRNGVWGPPAPMPA